jgi:hypothetical protein
VEEASDVKKQRNFEPAKIENKTTEVTEMDQFD